MTSIFRMLQVLVAALGLSSCDSIKSKALAMIDKKLEETGGKPGESEESSASSGSQELIRDLHINNYHDFISMPGHVVVAGFRADRCGKCLQLDPVLIKMVEQFEGRVVLGKIDVDKNQNLAMRERVQAIPDVRIFVNGKQVDAFVGMKPAPFVMERIESQLDNIVMPAVEPPVNPPAGQQSQPGQPTPDKPGPESQPQSQPEDSGQPGIKPMNKDWLPPGIQRKGI